MKIKFHKIIERLKFFLKKKRKLKVGLALGSGGSWGLAHIGVLKVLEENNIPIDYIAGSSMGAIIGAYYSLNPSIKELEEKVFSLSKKDFAKLLDLNIPKTSLIKGNKIRSFLEKLIGDKYFSDTKIPFKIVTTDLESGKEIVISKGKLVDAIMASISIPGIFPPIRLQEGLLVDGGLINATPTNVVKDMGSDVVIGVDLTMQNKIELKEPNIYQTLMRSYEILRTQSTKFNIDENDENLLIIKPNITELRKFKFYEIQKFVEEGDRVAREALPKIKKLINKS
jgi:NTE family protein